MPVDSFFWITLNADKIASLYCHRDTLHEIKSRHISLVACYLFEEQGTSESSNFDCHDEYNKSKFIS